MFKVLVVNEPDWKFKCECGEEFWASPGIIRGYILIGEKNMKMCKNCNSLHAVCPKCGLKQECKEEK